MAISEHEISEISLYLMSISHGWQWRKYKVQLEDGRRFTNELYEQIFKEEIQKIKHLVGDANLGNTKYEKAFELFDSLVKSREFQEFLTLKAYQEL